MNNFSILKNATWAMILTACLLSNTVNAQTLRTNATTVQDIIDPGMTNTDLLQSKTEKKIKGEPYFQREWARGQVIDDKGKYYESLMLSYSLFNDMVCVKVNEKVSVIDKRLIAKFSLLIGSKNYMFAKIPTNEYDIYAEVIYEGKLKLYRHYKKTIGKTGNGYNADITDIYLESETFYFQNIDSKKATPIKPNKKYFTTTFPTKAKALEEYWKKDKIKLKTDEELIKTLQFLETIL